MLLPPVGENTTGEGDHAPDLLAVDGNKSHHGSLMLYGHSHGSLPGTDQSLDVGVDCWDLAPTNLEKIMARMRTLPRYKHDDHHQPRERA